MEAGEARYRGSFNPLMPSLSISNRVSDSRKATGATRWSAEGTFSLDIFNMAGYAGVSSSRASLRRAQADRRVKSAEVRQNLRRAFIELLYAQEQITVASRVLDIRRQNSELVSLKYDSGRESKGNRLRASAELTEAKALLAQARRGLRVSRRELGRQLGIDHYAALIASGTLDSVSSAEPPSATQAGDDHPTIAARQASLNAAQASLRESASGLWPKLAATYSRTKQGRTNFPTEYGWSAGGTLSLPIFNSGPTAVYHGIQAAQDDLRKSQEDLRAASDQVGSARESAWAAWADKTDQVEVQKAFLEAGRQRNDEASVRYSSGLMSFENWELVVADLVNSERGLVRARRDAVLAEADWDKANGLTLGE